MKRMDASASRFIRSGLALLVIGAGACACSRHERPVTRVPAGPSATAIPPSPAKRCIVHLHGKSGTGAAASLEGDVTHLRPSGNAPGWGGLQWLYFPDDGYAEVQRIVSRAISEAGCGRVILHGFSNGASAAGKLYCRGETFGGTAVGYVLDDPVPDHAVEHCAPAKGVKVRVYWTSALAETIAGWSCSSSDFTCEGGTTIGIERYAAWLGQKPAPSVHQRHQPYDAPPEYVSWW